MTDADDLGGQPARLERQAERPADEPDANDSGVFKTGHWSPRIPNVGALHPEMRDSTAAQPRSQQELKRPVTFVSRAGQPGAARYMEAK